MYDKIVAVCWLIIQQGCIVVFLEIKMYIFWTSSLNVFSSYAMLNVPVGQYFANVAITAVKDSHIKHVVATHIFLFYLS